MRMLRAMRQDSKNHCSRLRGRPKQCPAKTFDDSHHRIEAVQSPPGFGQKRAGVSNGSRKEPELSDKGHSMTDVTVLNIQA